MEAMQPSTIMGVSSTPVICMSNAAVGIQLNPAWSSYHNYQFVYPMGVGVVIRCIYVERWEH